MKLILLRGPSGTGKSTIAKAIAGDMIMTPIFEADQYFTYNGSYKFNIAKLSIAHKLCQIQTERQMHHAVPIVIVTNTFIAHWEMERYLELGEEYRYAVEIVRSPRPWDAEVLFRRNKHNVPMDVVQRHINGYQPHPKEIEWTDLSIFNE